VFKLPRPAAAQDIEAEARHGVLAIRVAKAEDQRPRKIEIRTA